MSVHKCPVCEGKGFVPGGFYLPYLPPATTPTDAASFEKCRSCDGTGYIITPDPQSYQCNGCANCGNNDGLTYMSNPVKYKCTLTGEYHYASYACSRWIKKFVTTYLQGNNISEDSTDV